MKKEIKKIKKLMIQSLEKVDDKGTLHGDYLCHEDIPKDFGLFSTLTTFQIFGIY